MLQGVITDQIILNYWSWSSSLLQSDAEFKCIFPDQTYELLFIF